MKTITINIKNDKLADKVIGLLEFLKNEGLEIVSKEDIDDLKLLKETRGEESVSLEDYLKDENKAS
jgi:DNA-binding winged helix-turn-helix (wHTH) protein